MDICSYELCRKEIPLLHKKYKCHLCGDTYCDDHIANASRYLSHLNSHISKNIDEAIDKKKYVCINCLTTEHKMPTGWRRSFIDRKCSYKGCSTSLKDITTLKRSCKICGLFYCHRHSHSKSKPSNEFLETNLRYELAESICDSCIPSEEHASFIERPINNFTEKKKKEISQFLDEFKEQKAPELVESIFSKAEELSTEKIEALTKSLYLKYINFGVRSALSALCVMMLVILSPEFKHINSMGLFEIIWNVSLVSFSGIFMLKEFIIPALKEKESRLYAVLLIFLISAFILYSLNYNPSIFN